MSLQGDRQEIADALSAVDDVKGYKYRPTTLKKGDAWPLLGGLERGPANSYEATWNIAIILPTGEQKAMEWFDAHHELVADGLEELGYVQLIEPGTVLTEAGSLDAMIVTLRREA